MLPQPGSTGPYFARVKVNGKIFRETLDTTVFTSAKQKLHDFVKQKTRRKQVDGAPVTFKDARKLYAQYYNNVLGTLRGILKRGGLSGEHDPSRSVSRLGVKPKQLTLPEPAQFEQMLTETATSGTGQARQCAERGHSDGGALAMRTYGHLRQQHSLAMAQKVTFATTPVAAESEPKAA